MVVSRGIKKVKKNLLEDIASRLDRAPPLRIGVQLAEDELCLRFVLSELDLGKTKSGKKKGSSWLGE